MHPLTAVKINKIISLIVFLKKLSLMFLSVKNKKQIVVRMSLIHFSISKRRAD